MGVLKITNNLKNVFNAEVKISNKTSYTLLTYKLKNK